MLPLYFKHIDSRLCRAYTFLMKNMKFRHFIVLALTILITSMTNLTAQEIQFEFSMVQQDKHGNKANLDWKKDLLLIKGDQFYFNLKPFNTTVYLLYEDIEKKMTKLYPSQENQAGDDDRFRIPASGNFFTVTNPPGTEKIYLIALSKPDQVLSTLVSQLQETSKILQTSEKIRDRLAELKTQNSQLIQSAEKPVSVAGTSRGTEKDEYTEIKGGTFYAKTIRIKH